MPDFNATPISSRKTHQTGTVVEVFDNRHLDLETQAADGRWETLCVDHSTVMGFETKSAAISFASSPLDWCEVCMAREGMLRDVECHRAVGGGQLPQESEVGR